MPQRSPQEDDEERSQPEVDRPGEPPEAVDRQERVERAVHQRREEEEPEHARLRPDELLPERVAPDRAEEQVRGDGSERAHRDERRPHAPLGEVADVLHRGEAERGGRAVHDAVDRLVELAPMPREGPRPEELRPLLAEADDDREHDERDRERDQLAAQRHHGRVEVGRQGRKQDLEACGRNHAQASERERREHEPHRLGTSSVEPAHEEEPREGDEQRQDEARDGQRPVRRLVEEALSDEVG